MDDSLVKLVWQRAGRRCEYCLMPQDDGDAAREALAAGEELTALAVPD